jgi:hypothetical protein
MSLLARRLITGLTLVALMLPLAGCKVASEASNQAKPPSEPGAGQAKPDGGAPPGGAAPGQPGGPTGGPPVGQK